MPVAHPATLCAPASSSTVWSAPLVNDGASFTPSTVTVNVWLADSSSPPFAVPPLSRRTSVTVADPVALAAGVKVSVPLAATAGPAEKSAALVLSVIANVSVWPLSSAGPVDRFVAQAATDWAPASSFTA